MKRNPGRKTSADGIVEIFEKSGDVLKKIGEVRGSAIADVREFIADHTAAAHGNSKPVVVLSVNEEELKKWQAPRGKARVIHPEQVFASAFEASHALGYDYNDVSIRLSKAYKILEYQMAEQYGKNHSIRLRPKITVRGVTLQFLKDAKG